MLCLPLLLYDPLKSYNVKNQLATKYIFRQEQGMLTPPGN